MLCGKSSSQDETCSPKPSTGVTQDKANPHELHRGLGLGAGRCQGCRQHSLGGGCLGRVDSGRLQDRHLPRAAGQAEPQATTAQPCCAYSRESETDGVTETDGDSAAESWLSRYLGTDSES